jgi:LPPG:FO 2-phospho-L-lactate transferase
MTLLRFIWGARQVTGTFQNIVGLAGGVGGAKFLQGLAGAVPNESLTGIINTADDFELYGLHISPDVDTVMYTLAGIANPATGWGIAGDTRATLDGIAAYGEDPWFLVGDRDFSTHILRTDRMRKGASLSEVTAGLASALGVGMRLLPMTDDRVRTQVKVEDGWLDFQEYFVGRQHADRVIDVAFDGIVNALPAPGVLEAMREADLIFFCPSNPVVSIGPIVAVPGVRAAIAESRAPVVCISPIVAGKALKGPAAGMLGQRGFDVSALGVAEFYGDLVDVMVIDDADAVLASSIEALGKQVIVLQTIMGDRDDRVRFADDVLAGL